MKMTALKNMSRQNNTHEHKTMTTSNNHISSHNSNQLNSSNNNAAPSPLDTLPKPFVKSMKTLFDILDDRRTGFVRLSDIEKGWQEDAKGLPRGLLDSLRKLTPSNGLLSFERFCAGLKLCLLRNQAEATNSRRISSPIEAFHVEKKNTPMKVTRPPSAPLLEIENPLPSTPWHNSSNNISNNLLTAHRTLSMPQLSPDSSELEAEMQSLNIQQYTTPLAPPKPPRANTSSGPKKPSARNAFQTWQMGLLLNEMDASDCHIKRRKSIPSGNTSMTYIQNRGSADGGSSSDHHVAVATTPDDMPPPLHSKKISLTTNKRREARRHTLQNGIDYNLLKRLKLYEEERGVLILGLDAVEKARNWYLQRLSNVQKRIACLGRMGTEMEQWSEVQQERLNFQRARVLEVNRNLASLADSWESGGFPLHYNSTIRLPPKISASKTATIPRSSGASQNNGTIYSVPPAAAAAPAAAISSNCQQATNQHFSRDLHIRRLERENRALVHELYVMQQQQQQQQHRNHHQPTQNVHHIRHNAFNSNNFQLNQPQSSPVCSTSSGGLGLGDADVVY